MKKEPEPATKAALRIVEMKTHETKLRNLSLIQRNF